MNMRGKVAAASCGVLLAALAGCTLPGGASGSATPRPSPAPSANAPTTGPSASAATTATSASGPASPTPPTSPTTLPAQLPASVAASPGATLATLPDARTGAALDIPLIVRGIPLVNPLHGLSKGYAPTVGGTFQLVPAADAAYRQMTEDAKRQGLAIIWRVGYRSYETQAQLLATPPTAYGDDADSYIAKPGHSEHQAGLAVDVASAQGYGTRFPETKEFAWLRANSYKYGFILRYPHGKSAITGVSYEPWHYRYIGVDAAAAFGPNSDLTLEEYLGGR